MKTKPKQRRMEIFQDFCGERRIGADDMSKFIQRGVIGIDQLQYAHRHRRRAGQTVGRFERRE